MPRCVLFLMLLTACGVEGESEFTNDDFWADAGGLGDQPSGNLIPVWDVDDAQAETDRDNWPADWSALEEEILRLVNEERAKGGNCGGEPFPASEPLKLDVYLRTAARLHSEDMGAKDYFSHDSVDGRDFVQRIDEAGFTGQGPWGENIACGYPSPADAVAGWMTSPGHCSNILDPSFGVLGVGYAYDANSSYGHYWTQDFAGAN
jgi:uncharacterized protein YkwD